MMQVTRFVGLLTLLVSTMVLAQTNPVPLINQPLVPESIAPGGPGFTLTVNGTGFAPGSVVNWNGSPRTTQFVSGARLTATILASDIAIAGTADITIVNPLPGGGTSNHLLLTVTSVRAAVSLNISSVVVGTNPLNVTTADFNRDGFSDIAVASGGSNSVSILLGNGDGTFQPYVDYPTGAGTFCLTVGDFNGDGKPDLAVGTAGDSVSILLGNGDGTFQTKATYTVSSQVLSIATADFNRDGKLDLVIGDNQISILLGNGDGSFQPHQDFPSGGEILYALAIGDFNGDGILDVAAPNSTTNNVSILVGNGDGTFQPHMDFMTATFPTGVTTADLNGDGTLDLAVAASGSSSVSILLGNGNGTFQAHTDYAVNTSPVSLIGTDMNGDGKLDLVVTCEGLDFNSVALLLGNGDGTFQHSVTYDAGQAFSVVAVDFNKDGLLDLAITNLQSDTVGVLIQDLGSVVVLSPNKLKFPTQLVGTISHSQNVSLTNAGNNPVTIASITTGTVNFAQTNDCGISVPSGGSCTISVYSTPTAKGPLSGLLAIADNGGGSPQTVPLTGTGTVVSLSKTRLDFGDEPVGQTSGPQRITLKNTGNAMLKINGITITGANAGDFAEINACGTALVGGGSCQIQVTFTPTMTGIRKANVSISDNGGGSPQTVALKGTGT